MKNYGDASPEFLATFIFINGVDADQQTPKNNALIVTFNYKTHFSYYINYQTCIIYVFQCIIINFYKFTQKLKKVYNNKKVYKKLGIFEVDVVEWVFWCRPVIVEETLVLLDWFGDNVILREFKKKDFDFLTSEKEEEF